MTKLIFHGGVNTIGGNCVILEEDGSRIMIDNGMCFSKENKYYKDFLSARGPNDIRDYLQLGLIPEIKGIYGEKKLNDVCLSDVPSEGHYMLKSDLESYESYIKRTGQPYIIGLLLTHAHFDHVRNIKFMSPEIPIYCSKITHDLLKIMADLDKNNDFLKYSYYERKERVKGNFIDEIYKEKKWDKKREIICIKPCKPFNLDSFEIIGYPVDHSLSGAMAFKIITPSGKVIIYTGDIRFHGHNHEKIQSEKFVNAVKNPPVDALISEGTRIDEIKTMEFSEEDVYKEVLNILNSDENLSEKLIFTAFPWKSITRFLTVYQIAKELGRTLVIQPKLAYVLHWLQNNESLKIKDILRNMDIVIYLPRMVSMTYSLDDYKTPKIQISYNVNWKAEQAKGIDLQTLMYKRYYERENMHVRAYELRRNPSKYIMHLEFYNLKELIDIRPPEKSHFYNLKTEPFDEEGELDLKILNNWMKNFKLNCNAEFHASGHASGPEIIKMIERINPKVVFPIHTKNQETFFNVFTTLLPNTTIEKKQIIAGNEYII